MTILEAQQAVDQWIKTYGVRYFSELTNMAVLTEEVGELARVIARKYGDQSFKEGEKDNLGEEMADVLWVLLCLANQTGVDLTEELQKSTQSTSAISSPRLSFSPSLKLWSPYLRAITRASSPTSSVRTAIFVSSEK